MADPVAQPAAVDEHEAPPAPIVWYRRSMVQRPAHLVFRLMEMGPAGAFHRVGRAVAKRWANLPTRPWAIPGTDETQAVAMLGARMWKDPVAYLMTREAPRGFFDLRGRSRLAVLAETQVPSDVGRTVCEADALLADGIELLGQRVRPADPNFDWLADPRAGRLWPLRRLDEVDAVRGVAADVKFVWELNRHQFLALLARAWTYTGHERYAHHCVAMARSWIASNPPGMGINWASNLEVAVRSISWLWTLQFLLGSSALGTEDLRIWLVSLRHHREHLAQNLSTYTDATNHLIGEAAALALITAWLPEWERSDALWTLATRTLARELCRQVGRDGVDLEQAMSYQRFVLELVLQVIALADRNDIELPETIRSRATAMAGALRALTGPGQRAPRIGDSDDARGLPFFRDDPWDFGDTIAASEAVLRLRGSSTPLYESTIWLAGTPVRNTLPSEPSRPNEGSELLAQGGYAILRTRRDGQVDRLLFDCGPLGYRPHASHGHADLLSVLVDLGGEELLTDPGTFAYYDPDGRRDLFRATRSHNTVAVGGRDQADAVDRFKWINLPRTGRGPTRFGPDFDFVEGWHDGYRRLRPAVRHRRAVVRLSGAWLLIDWLEGTGEHRFLRSFHAVPNARLERCGPSAVRLQTSSGRRTLVIQDIIGPDDACRSVVEAGSYEYSERYARLASAPVVRFRDEAALPAIRLTWLSAGCEASLPGDVALRSVEGKRDAGWLALRLADAYGAAIRIVVRAPGAPVAVCGLVTTARAAIVREPPDSQPPQIFGAGGDVCVWARPPPRIRSRCSR